jgi:hypothetical protein
MSAAARPRRRRAPACPHPRTTTRATHTRCAGGRCCNHDATCDDCGAIVATESWNLAKGRAAHAAAYPGRPACT